MNIKIYLQGLIVQFELVCFIFTLLNEVHDTLFALLQPFPSDYIPPFQIAHFAASLECLLSVEHQKKVQQGAADSFAHNAMHTEF